MSYCSLETAVAGVLGMDLSKSSVDLDRLLPWPLPQYWLEPDFGPLHTGRMYEVKPLGHRLPILKHRQTESPDAASGSRHSSGSHGATHCRCRHTMLDVDVR